MDLAGFRSELADFDFESPRPLDELLSWTIEQMEHGLVHVTHPRCFGLLDPAPTFPAQCAERIVSTFNPQLATATTSPPAMKIEAHVIRSIARRAGFPPEAAGHLASGGSEANYTSLICALTRSNPGFAAKGARAFEGPPVFYITGKPPCMDEDRPPGGCRAVCPPSGRHRWAGPHGPERTDGRDPVTGAAVRSGDGGCHGRHDRCRNDRPIVGVRRTRPRQGLWYHVDAAWGGAVIASDRLRHVLSGIERADSITIDAHKWLATTMGCGMFITRHRDVLSSAFQVWTSFMPSNNASSDPYVTSVQWSRRFSDCACSCRSRRQDGADTQSMSSVWSTWPRRSRASCHAEDGRSLTRRRSGCCASNLHPALAMCARSWRASSPQATRGSQSHHSKAATSFALHHARRDQARRCSHAGRYTDRSG